MVRVVCANPGCAQPFDKLQSEVNRHASHFCQPSCFRAVVDRAALGRAGGSAPHRQPTTAARQSRSRKGGEARARNLSAERKREIALLGVQARMTKLSPIERSAIARRATMKRLGVKTWFGVPVAPPRLNSGTSPARGCEGGAKRQEDEPAPAFQGEWICG